MQAAKTKVEDGMAYTIKEGDYRQYGASAAGGGVVFTFEAEKEEDCSILLYGKDGGIRQELKVPESCCRGAIRSVFVAGLKAESLRYNYKISGTVVTDPYANRIIGRERWRDAGRVKNEFRVCGGYSDDTFSWGTDVHPEIPRHEMFLYKLNIRGFSMDAGIPAKERGTFAAVRDKIPYLKELGVTTVEFMPVYEFEELILKEKAVLPEYISWQVRKEDQIKPEACAMPERVNLWGYAPANYFAVKASYAKGQDAAVEWKKLIRALHENHMECVMEMYFPENVNQNLILDALRYWVREYHVDGFHLLGENLPVTQIAQDAWLRRTKIFCAGFENAVLWHPCRYPHLYVYNDEYLYPVRALLNHKNGGMDAFACQQRKQHQYHGFVNYISDNNGFSLRDLFCYEQKHNEDNGEENRDGSDWNLSANYGVEGRSRKQRIVRIRERQMCNAVAVLFLAQGVPLLYEGDETGDSQEGNNNAYCQDNPTGWVNWKKDEALRVVPGVCGADGSVSQGASRARRGYAKTAFRCKRNGVSRFVLSRRECVDFRSFRRETVFGHALLRKRGWRWNRGEKFLYVGCNFHMGPTRLALPKLPGKKKWYLLMDTARERAPFLKEEERVDAPRIELCGQSVVILTGK
ncbi:MAG: glycogen operon protein GlgX [Roseburia hominis]